MKNDEPIHPKAGDRFPRALYTRQAIREHQGNKFIEALPPLKDEEDLVAGMWKRADVLPEDRAEHTFVRQHMIASIPSSFMQPLTDHVLLATEVSKIIRAGYLTRNPSSPRFLRTMGIATGVMRDPTTARSRDNVSGHGMAVIGMSGVGKSTAIDAVLAKYPPVIWHPDLTGSLRMTHQVTSIKVSCPIDGSLGMVCRAFFTQLDRLLHTQYHTLYATRGTVEEMREAMAYLAYIHGLGVLVIDEVQNLATAKYARENTLLKFFLLLRDELQVPVIAIGTDEALPVLAGTLKHARRHAGQPIFDRMSDDGEFAVFCNAMFEAYYLREPLDPTPAFRAELYHLSQGIVDIVIKLWELAQARALVDGRESIDAGTLRLVYEVNLHLVHAHLDNLRNGRQMNGPAYEAALRAVRSDAAALSTFPVAMQTPRAAGGGRLPRAKPSAPPRSAGSGRPRASDADETTEEASATEASRLLEAVSARNPGHSAHSALKSAGFIRDLGAEVIAGG